MDENEASIMIQQLSKLLEFSLETGSNLISVSEELEHAKLYVEFQKNRYTDSFEVEFNIREEVLDYCCIILMFQPILENAIYHGIKPDDKKNLIVISAYCLGDDIIFSIRDDGIGMDKECLSTVRNNLANDYITEQHIGLANVNQRIKLIFGEKYGLEINSEKGLYSEVKIRVPKVEKGNLS